MQKIEKVGALALIVDTVPTEKKRDDETVATGHIVLDRYRVDEQGNVCLTKPGLSIEDLEGVIELIKAELDALTMRARVAPVRERLN